MIDVKETHEVTSGGLHTFRLVANADGNTVIVTGRGFNSREARGKAFRNLRYQLRKEGIAHDPRCIHC